MRKYGVRQEFVQHFTTHYYPVVSHSLRLATFQLKQAAEATLTLAQHWSFFVDGSHPYLNLNVGTDVTVAIHGSLSSTTLFQENILSMTLVCIKPTAK